MLARVATFALNDRMLTAALRTQSKTAELQLQEASGLVSTDFGGLGASARRVVNLQVAVSRSEAYVDAATSANSRVQTMYSACGTMADLLTTLRTELIASTENVDSAGGETLATTAAEWMQEFAATLNTQHNGRYVFAGSATETKPVDISSATYPAASSPSSADTSYYQGNDDVTSVRLSDEQVLSYGVTADNGAFEKALRAFNLVANVTTSPLDTDTLSEALDLATDALDEVIAVQTRLSLHSGAMERAIDTQTDFQDFATSLCTDLTSVDIAAVAAQLSTYQTQLEASYAAIAKVQSLNLIDYLR